MIKRPVPESITEEHIIEEAVARLKDLGLGEDVIANYKKGILMVSDTDGIFDFNSWPGKGMPELAVKDAKKLHIHPYHVIYTWEDLGEFYDVLYISHFPGDWEYERVNGRGYMMSYSYNANEPDLSEAGNIRLDLNQKQLTRIE